MSIDYYSVIGIIFDINNVVHFIKLWSSCKEGYIFVYKSIHERNKIKSVLIPGYCWVMNECSYVGSH